MIIDTHHHLWKYNPAEYGWIGKGMEKIRSDFIPANLEETIKHNDVSGVISIQARQTTEETDKLLFYASENDFIYGVVGWLHLTDPGIRDVIEQYSENKYFKGTRHVLQDEPDPEYMLREDFNRGIKILSEFNMIYEILIFEHHLPQTIKFVDRHPHQIFILDHIAKPLIKKNILSPWKENLKQLAQRENVFCKISGLVTEADRNHWEEKQLRPYLDTVLDAFGPSRLMYGSDWPVCLLACDYDQWLGIVRRFISSLSSHEQEQIMSKNAIRIYQIKE